MEYLRDNAGNIYMIGVLLVGLASALALFVGLWIFAGKSSRTWGVLFGWIPGGVAGIVGGSILGALWPLTLIGALCVGPPLWSAFTERI